MGIQIRQATDDDVEVLMGISRISMQTSYRGFVPDAYLDEDIVELGPKVWAKRRPLVSDRSKTGVAYDDNTGESVGYVLCEWNPDKEKDLVYVDHVHVLEKWQGAGIGKQLLFYAMEWARSKQIHQIYLYTFEANASAIQFYERFGMTHTSNDTTVIRDQTIHARRYEMHFE